MKYNVFRGSPVLEPIPDTLGFLEGADRILPAFGVDGDLEEGF